MTTVSYSPPELSSTASSQAATDAVANATADAAADAAAVERDTDAINAMQVKLFEEAMQFPQAGPTPEEAVAVVIEAEGNLDLAAERLFGPQKPIRRLVHPGLVDDTDPDASPMPPPLSFGNKSRLLALIASNAVAQDVLHRQLRALTLLRAYDMFNKVQLVTLATLPAQEPKDIAKLYKDLLLSISELTDTRTTTINTNSTSTSTQLNLTEMVFKQLPPDVRNAVKALMAAPSPMPPNTTLVTPTTVIRPNGEIRNLTDYDDDDEPQLIVDELDTYYDDTNNTAITDTDPEPAITVTDDSVLRDPPPNSARQDLT